MISESHYFLAFDGRAGKMQCFASNRHSRASEMQRLASDRHSRASKMQCFAGNCHSRASEMQRIAGNCYSLASKISASRAIVTVSRAKFNGFSGEMKFNNGRNINSIESSTNYEKISKKPVTIYLPYS